MAKKENLPALPRVETFTVAPNRYLWDAPYKPGEAAAPYKPGEVIYVVYGDGFARAYIHDLTVRHDYYGDWQEVYIVRRETKTGEFAKRTYKTYHGLVQLGYHRAGMAPDLPPNF